MAPTTVIALAVIPIRIIKRANGVIRRVTPLLSGILNTPRFYFLNAMTGESDDSSESENRVQL
jgi:hypothetical protein